MAAHVDARSEMTAGVAAAAAGQSATGPEEAREAGRPSAPTARETETIRRLVEGGRHHRAEAAGRRLIRRYAESSLAWELLSVVLHRGGKTEESIKALQSAASLSPERAEIRFNLGNLFRLSGRLREAEAAYRAALALRPDFADASVNLGVTLQAEGGAEEAMLCYRRAIAIDGRHAAAHSFLAMALARSGQLEGAEAHCRRAVEIDPNLAEAQSNLGGLLAKRGRPEEAEMCCRRAIALDPGLAGAWNNLGETMQAAARNSEAIDAYRRAVALNPGHADAHSNLLLCLSHEESVGAGELFAAHVEYGRRFERPLRASWPRHGNSRDPERELKIGLVSGDFRDHAAAFFLEPLLPHLAGSAGLSLHGYSNSLIEDETTSRLRGYFGNWNRVAGVADRVVAAQIEADSIDILIDLSGHTNGNRLPVFARKPAPVQASWIGYPGTTGLEAMDYYFSDRFLHPREPFAGQFTEKIVHLPAVTPFLPSREGRPVNTLPALSNGYLTLGSFNRPAKLSRAVIALWAKVLRALPEAKMVIGGLAGGSGASDLLSWFANEGVRAERLRLVARSGLGDYMALHNEVDFCLDAFPYGGCTTTTHALWMGVPTLSLEGATPAGREGTCFLSHLGMGNFIAVDADDFVGKALAIASGPEELARLRGSLRSRLAESALGKPGVIASGLSGCLRTMWRRWCAGLPPEAF